jgi:superfamily II DNA/RNA helicase
VHRLGRTARAGKEGEGVIMLAPFEAAFLKELRTLPVKELGSVEPDPASVEVRGWEGAVACGPGQLQSQGLTRSSS